MKITIDNLDGMGALDYSGWISAVEPLKVERKLNAPSTCGCMLDLNSATVRVPARKGRVVVTKLDGLVLFTGYVATEPELIYAGVGTTGPAYRVALHAISDEWLLDRQSVPPGGAGLGQNGIAALTTLTNRVGAGVFAIAGSAGVRNLGIFSRSRTGAGQRTREHLRTTCMRRIAWWAGIWACSRRVQSCTL